MNSCNTFLISVIIVVTQFLSVRSNFSPAPNHLPFLGFKQIAQNTPGPVNIDTKNATFLPTTPLLLIAGLSEKWRIIQTGESVEIVLDQPTTVGMITGGVLYGEVYVFHKFRFYWHDNVTSIGHYSASTVDGKQGAQLEPTAYWYNIKYGSFRNALKYRDGLVQTSSRVNLGPIPNPLFVPFNLYMNKIKKPGDSVAIPSMFVYPWYNLFPPNSVYYAYPSEYPDETTGKVYYCTTTIVLPLVPFNFISYGQFRDTFGSLVDASGKPLINAAKQFDPPRSRPERTSQGVVFANVFA